MKWWVRVEKTFGEFIRRHTWGEGLKLKLVEIEEAEDQQLGKGSAPLQMGC